MPVVELPPLFAEVTPYLERFANRLARFCGVEAVDLVNAALLRLWRDRDDVFAVADPAERLTRAKWVGRCGLIQAYRTAKRQRFRTLAVDPDVGDPFALIESREPDVVEGLDEFATLLGLARAEDVDLLTARYRDDMPTAELAAIAERHPTVIRLRLERAVGHLLAAMHV